MLPCFFSTKIILNFNGKLEWIFSAQKEDKVLQREARHISLFGDRLVKVREVEQLCSIEGFVASILKHVISRSLWFSYVFQEKRKETSLNVSQENQVADLKLNSLLAVINILVIIPYVCMLFVSSANRFVQSTTII